MSNILAWLAEELTSRNEIIILLLFRAEDFIVPGGGLLEESRGEGVLDRSVVSQQHRVRRTFGPAQ